MVYFRRNRCYSDMHLCKSTVGYKCRRYAVRTMVIIWADVLTVTTILLLSFLDKWECPLDKKFTHQQHYPCCNLIFHNSVTTEREREKRRNYSPFKLWQCDRQQPLGPTTILRHAAVTESRTWPLQNVRMWDSLPDLNLKLGWGAAYWTLAERLVLFWVCSECIQVWE